MPVWWRNLVIHQSIVCPFSPSAECAELLFPILPTMSAAVPSIAGELYMFGGKEESSDIGSQELLQLPRVGTTWHVVENLGTWPERRWD